MSIPKKWKIEQEKDREKEKVGGMREINNKEDIFLVQEQHDNFVAAVRK